MTLIVWFVCQCSCLPGYFLNGVRPNGEYSCLRAPIGDDRMTARGERDDSVQPEGEIRGRVFCGNGELAVVVNERRAGCRR